MTEVKEDPFEGLKWYDGFEIGLEGRVWPEEAYDAPACRLPAYAKEKVSEEVWRLSRNPNGHSFQFETDATKIYARWTYTSETHAGHSAGAGMDCYGLDATGDWRWVGKVNPWKFPDSDGGFNQKELDGQWRRYRVYLPFSTEVTKLEIGLSPEAGFKAITPRNIGDGKGIVYYGTSIVYGAGVCRPGMSHANLLGRWLDQPIANLGFAGRARMEPEVAELLAELDPKLFIFDPVPNMCPVMLAERVVPFFEIIRAKRPDTPILWVGDRVFGDATFCPGRDEEFQAKEKAAATELKKLVEGGMKGLTILPAQDWFGNDFEGTTDASHPSDLGAMNMAKKLYPHIARLMMM